jgi:predicted short-subunit dehydrogenase-like oxidoreductase (DUF2520 family)
VKKTTKYTISFIGSGKVATALALEFHQKGILINEIWSNDFKHADSLAKKINSNPIKKIEKMNPKTDLFIIAVKDDFIPLVAEKIPGKNPFIVHTSGTVALKALKTSSKNSGVFYPLQTFTGKSTVYLKSVPILMEGNNFEMEKRISYLAKLISDHVLKINSKQRSKIHLSAVFVSNFPNYFYSIAETILKKEKIPFEILLPLIEKVTTNLYSSLPSKNQTGPAIRKDKKTLVNHHELLKENKDWQNIYDTISQSIMNFPFEKPISKVKKK